MKHCPPRQATRRTFLQQAATTSMALPLLLREARGAAPSDRLHIAAVGVGGKGESDIALTSVGQQVVALCDVDQRRLEKAQAKYPGAKTYSDWRRMLEQADIDAVTVSTPDHMHAPIAVSAMQLGKHVYVQKPLAHTLREARRMTEIAQDQGVVTQMGNQNHSDSAYRTTVQLIQSGTIGKVREAHTWSNRPVWPQGIDRPERADPIPAWLNWEGWIGVAPYRPYIGPSEEAPRQRGAYHPFNWRGWLDFGVGALGDMGCHIFDPVVWSLELGSPVRVWSDGPAPNGETYPEWEIIHYEFPGTRHTAGDRIQMTWYDGGRQPPRELGPLPEGAKWPSSGGLYIGEKGTLLSPHGGMPRFLSHQQDPPPAIEPVASDDHYLQWTNACKGNGETTSAFDYSGPLTETVLLGTIAVRFPHKKLDWDAAKMRFTNETEANQFVHHAYRKGWEVEGI